MIWRRLECFIEVGRCLSYSKAAKKLYLSQSVVTHHVRNLEDDMGVKLLESTPHSVSFTAAGETLFNKIAPLFDEINNVLSSYDKNMPVYDVVISSTYMINYKIFTPIFNEFISVHPNVRIIPKQLYQNTVFEELKNNRIDACFCFEEEAKKYSDFTYFIPLFSIRRNGMLVHSQDPISKKDGLTYKDLRNHTIFLPKYIDENPRLAAFYNKIIKLKDSLQIEYVDDLLTAYTKVNQGLGIAPAMDYMPSNSKNVVLMYNKEDSLSVAGLCVNSSNDSMYVNELTLLLKSKYPFIAE